jgi:DNA-directed RNA polymerase specialized sigma24 family protein
VLQGQGRSTLWDDEGGRSTHIVTEVVNSVAMEELFEWLDRLDAVTAQEVARARNACWTWAQIAAALEVSSQAVHQRHVGRLAASQSSARGVDL